MRRARNRIWSYGLLTLVVGSVGTAGAQDMSGAGGMGPGSAMGGGMPPGASAGGMSGGGMSGGGMTSGGAMSRGAAPPAAGGGSSPDALFGLRPVTDAAVIPLEEALRLAATRSFDLRIARERLIQQELQVKKAWALLLPQINASANYTFNCIGSEAAPFLSCSDQTVEFLSEESLDQQKLLFSSLGTILEQVAEFEADPAAQAQLRQQAQELYATADGFEEAKADIKPIVVQPAQVVNGSLTFSMPLFSGRAVPLLQNAYTAVEAVDLAGAQARSALMLAVARAYFGAYTAKRMLAVANQQLASATAHRDAVQMRASLDAATPLTLRRAELDVIRASQSVRSTENAYRVAVGAIGNLIGVQEFFDVEEPPKQSPIESELDVEEMLQRAFSSRLDLQAQKRALEIADRNRLDAWLQFLPSINLVAQGRMTSNVNGFVATPFTGALMVTASLPLYDGGTRYANLKETASKIREELLKVRQIEQRIEGQVRGNRTDITLKQEALQLAEEGLVVAREASEQANSLYDVGAATPLDVSDANLAVYLAEMDVLRAELEVQQARLGLAYVVGAFPGALSVVADTLSDDETDLARQRATEQVAP